MIRAIVTDIEGTTSDISFVKNILFPYARAALPEFVHKHANDPDILTILNDARAYAADMNLTIEDLITVMTNWIDQDQKITSLKDLQGYIWRKGYEEGDLKGHIYMDAFVKLKEWHATRIKLYVYSSGSIMAQKLLFGYSDMGDMASLFDGYFDATTGPKREKNSYHKIASAIGFPADQILFLSDVIAELDAARAAGMQTIALNRDGIITDSNGHSIVTEFTKIQIDEKTA